MHKLLHKLLNLPNALTVVQVFRLTCINQAHDVNQQEKER